MGAEKYNKTYRKNHADKSKEYKKHYQKERPEKMKEYYENRKETSHRQLEATSHDSTFGNENLLQNMFKHDNLLNYNETEKIQNRKTQHEQICLAQEDIKNLNNVSQQEYDTKSQ